MPNSSSNKQQKALYFFALFSFLGLTSIYFLKAQSDSLALFSNLLRPILAGITLLAAGLALSHYWENLDSTLSRIWLSFALGMMFWFFSELDWAVLTLVSNLQNPYPSTVDVYRLMGYGALFFAIFVYIGLFHTVVSSKIVAIATAATLPTSAGIIPSILLLVRGKASTMNFAALFVTVAYPLFDLVLFAQAMLCLLVFTITGLKGRVKGAWTLLTGGILMHVFGDLLLSYTNLHGVYYEGHPLELFFHAGYILFSLAFYTHIKEL